MSPLHSPVSLFLFTAGECPVGDLFGLLLASEYENPRVLRFHDLDSLLCSTETIHKIRLDLKKNNRLVPSDPQTHYMTTTCDWYLITGAVVYSNAPYSGYGLRV